MLKFLFEREPCYFFKESKVNMSFFIEIKNLFFSKYPIGFYNWSFLPFDKDDD